MRDIQQALHPTRPRAYTTIMTILDRLAQKGIVLRRKSGRAWVYRPNLTAEEARSRALAQLVDGFFEGSSEGLVTHLAVQREAPPAAVLQRDHARASFGSGKFRCPAWSPVRVSRSQHLRRRSPKHLLLPGSTPAYCRVARPDAYAFPQN